MPVTVVQAKPVHALYVVYVLQSTVLPGALYVGSTPDPQRRLRQHNGEVKGGAARTSRLNKRPWEMIAVVSGFPGTVAALKFEWALDHPHITSHIPPEQRVSKPAGRKRPRKTIATLAANLHLLLRAPVFSRWPLKMHFFKENLHTAWSKYAAKLPKGEQLCAQVPVLTDFGPTVEAALINEAVSVAAVADIGSNRAQSPPKSPSKARKKAAPGSPSKSQPRPAKEVAASTWGMHALPLDYSPLRTYIEKAHNLFEFEEQGDCVFCGGELPEAQGMYAVCPASVCEAVGHLKCWSSHLLAEERKQKTTSMARNAEAAREVVPVTGWCKSCKAQVQWGDMMKELTLRMRGQKEVAALLNPKKKKRQKAHNDGDQAETDKEDDNEEEEDVYDMPEAEE